MHQEYIKWHSASLGRDMEIIRFGHAGTPLLVFPSSMGRYYEWRDFGMMDAMGTQIANGQNQVFCVDSVDRESFYNRNTNPYVRIKRHQQYEQYILNEVVPMIKSTAKHDFIMVSGASFGAYHAADMAFKFPWAFGKLIALSGAFDIKIFMDGFYDDNVYFSNPPDFLSGNLDGDLLNKIRKLHLIFALGEHDPCREANERMSRILHEKGIGHTLEVWEGFGHDWPWWHKMIVKHL
ncbi:MAG: esterase family protein [Bacteroidetes Order II. Incertae sedis bacterium]|nr:esterase family protein [Bacteroidetes Order II. bacterium]